MTKAKKEFYATGKRKSSIAKVWLKAGTGKIVVNGKNMDEWLGGHIAKKIEVMMPLVATKSSSSVDIVAKTFGGGYSAQADALKHGISKSLVIFDPSFRAILKPEGMLTRDARRVERKRYGKKKARKSPQFSKR